VSTDKALIIYPPLSKSRTVCPARHARSAQYGIVFKKSYAYVVSLQNNRQIALGFRKIESYRPLFSKKL
jgi:hypothetical protein